LITALLATGVLVAGLAAGGTAPASAGSATDARTAGTATDATPGTLPLLPDGLNVAVGAHVTAGSGSAPGTSLSNIDDGDGTTRWCPSTLGVHSVTLDLGRVVDVTGTGATFSGEEGLDGSFYRVSTGITRPDQTPFPNQAPLDRNTITQGPLYLFSGTTPDVTATIPARYVTLTYQVPREQNICVQEFRVFSASAQARPDLELGDDLSAIDADTGGYTVNGQSAPLLSIVRGGGVNYVKLRLLTGLDLASDLSAASRARADGLKILLDIEYSDSPTSPAAQATPAAWAGQSLPVLASTVRAYTESVLKAFAANGTPVSQVAIGNEITQGFLWPAGQLRQVPDGTTSGLTAFTTLLKAAIGGARAGNPAGNKLKVQLDVDTGADATTSAGFFGHLAAARVPFDVIGVSYSPWLQGSLSDLKANLLGLITTFRKPVLIAQGQFPYADVTGYGSYSTTVPYPDTLPGYLITPAGQASYERDLVSLLASLPGGNGLGAFYLSPATPSPDTAASLGEFTPAGAAEPAVDAYRVGSGATNYGDGPGAVPVAAVPSGAPAPGPSQPAQNGTAALPGTLPPLPSGLNVAIGAKTTANSGSAPGEPLGNAVDGDGTTRWCPNTAGAHTVTVDLGRVVNVTGTGITFSGEQPGDGATYTVSIGTTRPGQAPFPNQAAGGGDAIAEGSLYLFSGTSSDVAKTVQARYVTLSYQVPRQETVCVQELRVFAPAAARQQDQQGQLELGSDLSTLISDTGTYTLDGQSEPILSIFSSGGMNYVRLRLWINPASGNFGTPLEPPFCAPASCPDLANDLTMAAAAKAAGMKLLLDIHYSDTWADPQHQNTPGAWLGETLPRLTASIHDYTQSAIGAFAANGTPVSQVAIGNEITQGLLWNYTTLNADATTVTPAGTTTIPVTSSSGIGPGDTLYIDSLATSNSIAGVADPSTEIVKVASVSPGEITLASPLRHSHTGPATVQDVQDSGHLLFNDATGQADWTSLTTLLKAAIAGAKAGNPAGNPLLVQLHIDRGGDNAGATDFLDHMTAAGVPFDVIGLSYYPWYHGPMSAMKASLTALIARFHKYVMIAEDQFPQNAETGYGDYNAADANYPDTIPGYLVTPAGQASYQRDLVSLIASLPDGRGLGVYYWDGDSSGVLGMFGRDRSAQPVVDAYQIGATPTAPPISRPLIRTERGICPRKPSCHAWSARATASR
jgi:arabinogalactan endo-1,4-beta-galactosidase